MKLQEHEYKARDKTVHKMSRDGLREENLHNKEEKRITSRDEDIEVSRNPKKEEDFGKNRRERIKESKDVPTRKKPFDITRYSIDEEQKVKMEQNLGNGDAKEDMSLTEDSGPDKHAVFRTESIRGQPRSERAALETAVDSRKLRQRKMVRDYAEREKRKEKEASRQQKTAEKENIRYRETSQVTEESLEGFQDEIKGKVKRERILKEQKKQSRLFLGDKGDGMVHGAGTGIRKSASAVKNAALTVGYWKAHEAEDDNAAVEGAHRMELAGESLARKSIYVRQRLRESRKQSARLTENMLDEAENSRLMFDAAYGNQAKNAVKREADQKKKSALQKLLQKKRYQKQYRAAKESKKAKDAAITSAQRFTEKTKDAVKMVAAQNKGIFATVALFGLIFVLIAVSFSSCSAVLQGGSSAIISTSYSSTDEDIYAAENAYKALEEALNTQINQIEFRHPDYDEYRYQIDEIGHNPYQLISYLTVKYGGFTYAEVADEIKEIFQQQYGINTQSTRETVTETKTVRVGESLGQVVTSGYCNCSICCGQWSGGPTASGAMPTANHTIAVDATNPFVPIGTHVVMNGVEYVVEDTGAFARYGVQFDVYYDNHAVAEAHGHQTWECFLAEGNQNSVEVTRTVTADVLNVSVQAKPLRSVILSRMEEDEQEIYEEVYSNRGNLQTYKTPVELNWYAYISTYYGYSVNNGTGQTQLHRGVTINVRQGTEVKSAMNGFVVDVGYSGTFGNYVVTQDKKGVQIKYAYLQSISVANGQEVTTDTVIGTTGSTGSATGSQLYLELVKDGEYYNPVFYISTGDSGLYGGGGSYDDETVRRLFAEADKYLGMPYVWGGSSPETSFDCSGFVSYVFTNSGVCNMGRLTAQGIYDICMPVSPEEARPGDIIFFTGTYDAGEPVTHVGIYAGDGQMIHCGNPIQYTSINSAYWQSHFYAFGRP